jgi:hypothetical protein
LIVEDSDSLVRGADGGEPVELTHWGCCVVVVAAIRGWLIRA